MSTTKEKKLSPFDILNGMSKGRKFYSKDDVEKSKLSLYLLLTFVSANYQLISLANYINNEYKTISLYDAYLFLFLHMKENKISCRWVKRDKMITSKTTEIELLMRYFRVKENVAERYLNIFTKEDLDYFGQIYRGVNSDKVKF